MGRLLHNRWPDSNSFSWRLLGSTSATPRYKVRVCRIKTQEIAVFYGGSINVNPGGILLGGRFLHNRCTDSNSDSRRLLGLISASQRYKVRLHRMKAQEVAVHSGGGTLAEFYLMADSSAAAARISILFSGDCWAQRQLHAGIRYVSVGSKLRKSLSSMEGVSMLTLAEFYSMADSSPTAGHIPILFSGGCWARC